MTPWYRGSREPGFDPAQDGCAAPYFEFNLKEFLDGTCLVEFPDDEQGLYESYSDALRATAAWVKTHYPEAV